VGALWLGAQDPQKGSGHSQEARNSAQQVVDSLIWARRDPAGFLTGIILAADVSLKVLPTGDRPAPRPHQSRSRGLQLSLRVPRNRLKAGDGGVFVCWLRRLCAFVTTLGRWATRLLALLDGEVHGHAVHVVRDSVSPSSFSTMLQRALSDRPHRKRLSRRGTRRGDT
jgi:hypothetical protein